MHLPLTFISLLMPFYSLWTEVAFTLEHQILFRNRNVCKWPTENVIMVKWPTEVVALE